jgi:DNA-directed RNA polymerase specialized sigma24 family protein
MSTIAPSSSLEPTDEQLLVAALRGDRLAWAKLFIALDRYLVAAVRRRAPDLPDDLRREVIQELWAEVWADVVLRPSGDFDPSTLPARHYIAGFISLGLDRVRAAYRAPGERSRWRDAKRSSAHSAYKGREPVLAYTCREPVSVYELSENEQPKDPRSQAERDKVEAVIDIQRARHLASQPLATAIDMMWEEDAGYEAAATAVGINRVTLRRQLRQLGLRLAVA